MKEERKERKKEREAKKQTNKQTKNKEKRRRPCTFPYRCFLKQFPPEFVYNWF